MFRVGLVLIINSSSDRRSAIVVQVVMEKSITASEELLLEEQWIVQQRQSIEDIEFGLGMMSIFFEWSVKQSTNLFSEDQSIFDQEIQPCLKLHLVRIEG